MDSFFSKVTVFNFNRNDLRQEKFHMKFGQLFGKCFFYRIFVPTSI